MSVVVLLIVAGGIVAAGFLAAFAWAVQSGQYDDTCTPAVRVLLEDGQMRTTAAEGPAQRPASNAAGESQGRRAPNKQEGMSHVDVNH